MPSFIAETGKKEEEGRFFGRRHHPELRKRFAATATAIRWPSSETRGLQHLRFG
ncbi:unnamed protein product, partial [Nesidiocoris tenuis]